MTEFILTTILLTGKIAAIATAFALLAGVAAAWAMHRRTFAGRSLIDALLMLPLVLPPTVLGYYLLTALGRKSPFGRWLEQTFDIRLIFTWQGAVIAAAIVAFPLVYQGARAALAAVDQQLEGAARTLGAGEWRVFVRVTLPLAWPGVLAGTMLAFARAMGEFGATLMVAGSLPGRTQTLALAIYDSVQAGRDGEALILVGVTSLVCVLILVVAARVLRSRHP
ncbi:MAG: molybdate ABC transporter permease subunit [Gammaproteobacteria bacterium PRO9]|nr:molybdate ABC transporter permease subunit [Gammaproteobacteria bacterium PRO9]